MNPMNPLLSIENLTTSFKTERGWQHAIDGVSLDIFPGEVVGLVGESGCGKSVTMQSVLRLYEGEGTLVRYDGAARLDGRDLMSAPKRHMREVRGRDIAMIFQDALSSLDPVFPVGWQIEEALKRHTTLAQAQRSERIVSLLRTVGLSEPERRARQYPHELSGGMRQRVMIAIALSCQPRLLIADEPTTALDVTVEAQIIDLLLDLNASLGMSVLLITHDMAVVSQTCSRVAVMYLGQVVEEAGVYDLFDTPLHPYTRGLIRSIPRLTGLRQNRLYQIDGSVPPLSQVPAGCRFAPRCPLAAPRCHAEMPPMRDFGSRHKARCWRTEEADA